MANENSSNIVPPTVVVPSGYSNSPLVGKIQQLYDANNNNLYKKLSPYTENSGLLSFGPRQPYVYVNPNQGRKGINGLKRFESRIFPIGSALQDVQRIAKFLGTGNGIIFLIKQFALQRSNAFNEVRIFNPVSPLNGSIRAASAFILPRASRHLDLSPAGILAAFTGISVGGPSKVKGTIGTVTPDRYKGLVRAKTANSALEQFKIRHAGSEKKNSILSQLGGPVAAIKGLFDSFGGNKQDAKEHHGENAYEIMLGDKKLSGVDGEAIEQRWYNPKIKGTPNINRRLVFNATGDRQSREIKTDGSKLNGISIGYKLKDKIKYGDILGSLYGEEGEPNNGYENSDIILIYNSLKETSQIIPRDISKNKSPEKLAYDVSGSYSYKKKDDPKSGVYTLHGSGMGSGLSGRAGENIIPEPDIDATGNQISVRGKEDTNEHKKKLVESLNSLLKNLNGYDTSGWKSRVDITYNSLINQKNNQPGRSTVNGYENSVSSSRRIDKSKGIESNRADRINSLFILRRGIDENKFINYEDGETYSPYEDDFIAFYFHDLVNDTYIPFRATVKGINESATANWSEISYIGRADKLFNYTGFSRSLSFNFKVVAMSIKELLPMWTRINYLVGLTKPAGYTDYKSDEVVSKFIIPPLVNITIGDLYKEQPVVLKSVTISIPEDAIWELTPELNNESNEWKYLNDKIVWKNSGGKYAQFPTECDIQISTDILETERPRTGRRNFGGGSDSNGGFSRQLIVT
jgi:hypothetical protein